nr:PREDICTED: uncharacterized protein LOC109034256 [Bemisia tabaci]
MIHADMNFKAFDRMRKSRETYKNRFPVILFSFRDVNAKDFKTSESAVYSIIQQQFKEHSYLLTNNSLNLFNSLQLGMIMNGTSSIETVRNGIFSLCDFLGNVKKLIKENIAVILLVDDYDTPLRAAYMNNYLPEMSRLLSNVLSCLTTSPFVKKGIITGLYSISSGDIFPKRSTKIISVFNDQKRPYFGFTAPEVNNLLQGISGSVGMKDLTEWYALDSPVTKYNPWSVLYCLANKGALAPYWVRSSDSRLVSNLLSLIGVSEAVSFIYLVQGGIIEKFVHRSVPFEALTSEAEYFWTVLVHGGYLSANFVKEDSSRKIYSLVISNFEIKNEINHWCRTRLSEAVRKTTVKLAEFVKNTMHGEVEKIMDFLLECMQKTGIYYNFENPAHLGRYYTYFAALFTPLRDHYTITENQTEKNVNMRRRRCYSFVLEPKNYSTVGIIMEIEGANISTDMKKTAEMVLKRMKNGELPPHILTVCGKVLAIGMAFYRHNFEFSYDLIGAQVL